MPNPCCRERRKRTMRTWRWPRPTTSSEPFRRHALFAWFGGIQATRSSHGATGKKPSTETVLAAVRADFAGARSAQGKTGRGGAKAPAANSAKTTRKARSLQPRVCQGDGPDHSLHNASSARFLPVGAQRLFKKQRQAILFWNRIAIPQLEAEAGICFKRLVEGPRNFSSTGGGTGLGGPTPCSELAARMFLIGRREEPLRVTCDEIHRAGGEAAFTTCDVRDTEPVEAAAAKARRQFGEINASVNNAAGNSLPGRKSSTPNAFNAG